MPIPRRASRIAGALGLMGRIAGARFAGHSRRAVRMEPAGDGFFRRQFAEEAIERDPKNPAGEKMPELDEKFVGNLFVGREITPEAMHFFRQCGLSDAETRNLFEFLRKGLYGHEEKQQFIKLMVELRAELLDIMFLLGKWQKYGAKIEPEIGNNYRALFTALLRTTPNYAKQHLKEWLNRLDQILKQEEMMRKMMQGH